VKIEITKRADGCGVLRCTRDDGSVTWQKQTVTHAPHFALHDMTHFAVESALGFSNGFFGLVAQGWDIDQTTGKSSRGPIPAEALEVESLVGTFDSERACGQIWTAQEFNEMAALNASNRNRPAPRKLDQDDLARVRALRSRLFEQWRAVEPGAALELEFHLAGCESGLPSQPR
jgi:hypothetical protein